MPLMLRLGSRLFAVAFVCLIAALVWSVRDAHDAIERATTATAERVAKQLELLYWRELLWRGGVAKEPLLPTPEWRSLATLALIAPGTCVDFRFADEAPARLCGQVDGVGDAPPRWFASLYRALGGRDRSAYRPLSERQRPAGSILVGADPEAAARLAWDRASRLAGLAAALTAAIALLSALAIAKALAPALEIIEALQRLSRGDHSARVPRARWTEFTPIAEAVDSLAARLGDAAAERAALTLKLIAARQDERRDLARELHDEFGQCLAATAMLAGAIEAGAGPERPDLAEDAREIERLAGRMGGALRDALERLSQPVTEEAGLEASLMELVAGCNARAAPRVAVRLEIEGSLTGLSRTVASGVYRIAQEGLANALRHGVPSEVRVMVARQAARGDVLLMVEDDGGGDAARIVAAPGRGVTGMAARVAELGGRLSIRAAARGVRVAASIPAAA